MRCSLISLMHCSLDAVRAIVLILVPTDDNRFLYFPSITTKG